MEQLERPQTYDDLIALPEDGNRYELIGGELYEMPRPDFFHQWAIGMLVWRVLDWALPRKLGLPVVAPFDVRLDARNIVQPDIMFISRENRRLLKNGKASFIDGVPDLMMEILSPSNRGYDFIKKAALYATFGVREYWIVDPEARTILVQVLRDGIFVPLTFEDGVIRSDVLAGLEINPAELLAIPEWMGFDDDETEGATGADDGE